MSAEDRAYKVGVSNGLHRASMEAMSASIGYFRSGRYDLARALRELANELDTLSDREHPGEPTEGAE